MKICQFKLAMLTEGGGERVMRAICKVLKTKIYTTVKEIKGDEIEEISTEAERQITRKIGTV